MSRDTLPSFSSAHKWNAALNVAVTVVLAGCILVMINYLAARHFKRFAWSATAQGELSPQTVRVLESITNDVRIIIFFDREAPLYDKVSDLLRQYQFYNAHLTVETLDYIRDLAKAQLLKVQYKLNQVVDKDLVIFESNGRTKTVYQNELSELDMQDLMAGRSREVKRTHFKGEMLFTSAIMSVTRVRALKAYFVQGNGEHSPDDDDEDKGYSKFATMLKANNVEWGKLSLEGTNEVPGDCNLLLLAGPSTAMHPVQLDKIGRYLKNGGRMLSLLNLFGLEKNEGVAQLLAEWGVRVGKDLIQDLPNSNVGQDIMVREYGMHPITRALVSTRLHVVVPRSIQPAPARGASADAPSVTGLFYTGPKGTIITDIRNGVPYPNPATDTQTNVCLAVAVEKGKIRDLSADRGTTRLVVVGDSFFLNNRMIDSAANRDFAVLAINWLLDRSEMLAGLGPKPIREYRLEITKSHMRAMRWIFLGAMPGSVFLAGLVVWTRRRR